MADLRGLPSVDQLTKDVAFERLVSTYGRSLVIDALRLVLDGVRAAIKADHRALIPTNTGLFARAESELQALLKPTMAPVINATGVILHTNLGRAPISRAACEAFEQASLNYHTLEFDLGAGKRGSRSIHAESLLKRLAGVEAALVVNNNAAALLLCLSALARRKRVVIARSQLVEIGGGFRIPDVMTQSGAKLVEVGTTNRVHIGDFEDALKMPAALVLRVHHSNYKIVGFTAEPELASMVELAHSFGVPVLDDLGSGALLDTARFGLAHEPMVQESIAAGADLVCLSGDKLLGGPQAGIILGKSSLVDKIRKHPLARVVRADKACLATLSATLLHYLKEEAETEIPIWKMIALSPDQLFARVQKWRSTLACGDVIEGRSTIGGGSLPEETQPTWLWAISGVPAPGLMAKLRAATPAIIARIDNDRVVLDPRTVFEDQEEAFLSVMKTILKK